MNYVTGHGNKGAHSAQSGIYGYYNAQPGTYDGKSWYKSSDGRAAVWYNIAMEGWVIGPIEDVGTNTCGAYVLSTDSCPYDPAFSWKFFSVDYDSWYDADKTLSIWCKS